MAPNPLTTVIDIGGIWHITFFFGLSLGIMKWMSAWPKWTVPLSVKLLWAYVLIYALFILEYPALHFGAYTSAYQIQAGQVLVEALLIPLSAMLFSQIIWQYLWIPVLYTALCVWLQWDGFLIASSF